jgi:hypothetical protein
VNWGDSAVRWLLGLDWGRLVPTLPNGFDEWEGFTLLFALFVLKTVRPVFLKRRSSYVDRFGWSILLFDFIFSVFVGISAFYLLYPEQRTWVGSIWLNRIMIGLLVASALWQVVEVVIARPVRVEVTMAGVPVNDTPWEAGKSAERRKGYRRLSDEQMASDATAYRQGINRMQGGV